MGTSVTGSDLRRITQFRFFEALDEKTRQLIAAKCTAKSLTENEILINKGSSSRNLALLLYGSLTVHLNSVNDDPVANIPPGEVVGELSYIDGAPASAFVVAHEPSRVLFLEEKFLSKHPVFANQISQLLLDTMARRSRDKFQLIGKERSRLRHTTEKFFKAFHTSPHGMIISSLKDGRIMEVNETFLRESGYRADQLKGRTTTDISGWKNLEDRKQYVAELQKNRFVRDREVSFRNKSGAERTVLISGELIEIDDQQCAITAIKDITERKEGEEKLRLQAEQFRAVVNNIAEALVIVDSSATIRFVNPVGKRLLGYSVEDDTLEGQPIGNILNSPYDEEYTAHFQETPSSENRNSHIHHGPRIVIGKRRGGEVIEMDLSVFPIFVSDPLFIGLLRDRSLRKRTDDERLHLAHDELRISELEELLRVVNLDSLTNIPNRRRFDRVVKDEWERCGRNRTKLAVILFDVDNFKAYNDNYDHQRGDDCLKSVASVLEKNLKRPTDFVARYGGEEFVVVLPAINNEQGAMVVAENIRKDIEALAIEHTGSSTGYVTVSGGVGIVTPDRSMRYQDLIKSADNAMYKAKDSGRNQIRLAE